MSEAMKMCDLCPDEVAVAMFKWPWEGPDSEGHCSVKGQFLLKQQAKNLRREVQFLPLAGVKVPLKRDERTRLIAEKLSAESERDETSERASRLFEQSTELSKEVKSLKLSNEQAAAARRDLESDLDEAQTDLAAATKDSARLSKEVQKLDGLVKAGLGEAEGEIVSLREQLAKANKELDAARKPKK